MQLNQKVLWVLIGILIVVAQWPDTVRAEVNASGVEDTTNVAAIVSELKDLKAKPIGLSRLDEMVTNWKGTNFVIFSPAIDYLMPMIGIGGIDRMWSRQAEDILVKLHSVSLPRLVEATKSPEVTQRRASARILGRIRPVESDAINALSEFAADKDSEVRRFSFYALAGFGIQASNTIPLLLGATNDPDVYNRMIIYSALANMTKKTNPYIPLIVSYLTNEDADVRCFAPTRLGACGLLASNAYPQLLLVLKNGEPQLRINAAEALGNIRANNPEVIKALIASLENDSELYIRETSAVSLGRFGSTASNAVPALIKILHKANADSGGNATGWWVAASALGGIGGDQASQALEDSLKNSDPDIRRTAARVLQMIKDGKQWDINNRYD